MILMVLSTLSKYIQEKYTKITMPLGILNYKAALLNYK